MFLSSSTYATAGINQQINFQGRLLNSAGATVPDGYYNVQFKIYQDGDGQTAGNTTGSPAGVLKWTESHLNVTSQGVTVKNGYFSVDLGGITPFGSSIDWNQDTLWISINIGNTNLSCTPFTSCTPDGEMLPMRRLSATPYALNSNLLGGLNSTQYLRLAQGVQTDASSTNSIYVNKTGSGNFATFQNNGTDVLSLTNSGDIAFGANADHTLSVSTAGAGVAGKNLSLSAGAAGTGGTALVGGSLSITGGAGGGTNGAGGNVIISGGTGSGSGTQGLVVISTPTFQTAVNTTCPSTPCTISQANVDSNSVIVVNTSGAGYVVTLPNPTINGPTAYGRLVYITSASAADFTLAVNGGVGVTNQIAMRNNTSATMVWGPNGWTAAGASSSTTLQAAYDNTLQSAGGAELVVAKTANTNGLTIRDSSTSSVNGALLSVQSSSAANLFSVSSNVTEYASDAGAEVAGGSSSTFPASTWASIGGANVTRYTTAGGNIATGQASVSTVTGTAANDGVKNTLTTTLTANNHYNVSFAARLASGTFTDMSIYYSVDGTTASTQCGTTNQTVSTSVWTKVNCSFTAPSSGMNGSNAILIRQVGSGTAHTFYIDNLSVTIAADYSLVADGGADTSGGIGTSGTTWNLATGGSATVSAFAQDPNDGQAASTSVKVTNLSNTANAGIRNKLSINPLMNTLYRVTVYAKLASGSFTDFTVRYSPTGSQSSGASDYINCVDYNSQTIATSSWTKVTCYIKTDNVTSPTTPYLYFVQAAAPGSTRTFSVDTASMTLATSTTPNVQIGSGNNGGPTTLFTLDKGASAPIAGDNEALLGSMYYDTTLGKLQCYEADGWGACGSSPDNIITISPEYTNAVMHGTGVGTMTSDLCSDFLNINDSGGTTICGANETYNFYKWTSPQASDQAYAIYVTYQLPSTFKSFTSGSTSLQARVDSTTNASVKMQIFKNHAGSNLAACGNDTTITTSNNTWQSPPASGTADPSTCGFTGNDSIVFKITMSSKSNANAYIGNVGFTFTNN